MMKKKKKKETKRKKKKTKTKTHKFYVITMLFEKILDQLSFRLTCAK